MVIFKTRQSVNFMRVCTSCVQFCMSTILADQHKVWRCTAPWTGEGTGGKFFFGVRWGVFIARAKTCFQEACPSRAAAVGLPPSKWRLKERKLRKRLDSCEYTGA
jgi:hypothetical protein